MGYYIIILLLPLSLLSASYQEQFQLAKNYFQIGKYQKAVGLLEKMQTKTSGSEQLVQIYELLGSGYYFQNKKEKSSEYFRNLLSIDRKYKLDPLLYPPPLVLFYDRIQKEFEEKNKLIENIDIKEQKVKEKIVIKEVQYEVDRLKTITVNENPFFFSMVPFGYAQFRNNQSAKGYIFLTTESLLLTLNIISYWAVYNLNENGFYTGNNLSQAQVYQKIQTYSLIALGITLAIGLADGIYNYQPVYRKTIDIKQKKPVKISLSPKHLLGINIQF